MVDRASDVVEAVGSALDADVNFLLARANAMSMSAANRALAPLELKVRSYSVLALACAAAPPSQREIAEYLRLDPSQVVALVDDLQKRGLVERRADPSDRRTNVVGATPTGVELRAEAAAATQAAESELYVGLSPAQRQSLTRMLRTVAFPTE
ncbi:MarR family transcriptional regulator [Microbacterium sediminicola]|uniref:MarR family transcriptional regulator n=1 Tax=Microbacterium sediminicola TaxID=415210 RepID=A0ABN2IB07_9MICO